MNLLQVYCRVGYWKNFENQLIFSGYGQEYGVLFILTHAVQRVWREMTAGRPTVRSQRSVRYGGPPGLAVRLTV